MFHLIIKHCQVPLSSTIDSLGRDTGSDFISPVSAKLLHPDSRHGLALHTDAEIIINAESEEGLKER